MRVPLIYFYMTELQYTVTHKQYTEKHNETEYTERNINNNKNM